MFGKFCLRVAVGIGLFLLFGGNDAFGVLVMSVVCTAGVGLIVVVPAAYLLGLVCTIWFIPFGMRGEEPAEDRSAERPGANTPEPRRSHSLAESSSLREYAVAADAQGRDWNSIRDELLRAGWDPDAVERLWSQVGIGNPSDS